MARSSTELSRLVTNGKATYNIAAWRSNLNGEIIEAKEALRSSVILDVIKLSTPV